MHCRVFHLFLLFSTSKHEMCDRTLLWLQVLQHLQREINKKSCLRPGRMQKILTRAVRRKQSYIFFGLTSISKFFGQGIQWCAHFFSTIVSFFWGVEQTSVFHICIAGVRLHKLINQSLTSNK